MTPEVARIVAMIEANPTRALANMTATEAQVLVEAVRGPTDPDYQDLRRKLGAAEVMVAEAIRERDEARAQRDEALAAREASVDSLRGRERLPRCSSAERALLDALHGLAETW